MKTSLILGGALALCAAPALAAPEYVTIHMEVDVDAPAEVLWERVGDYCDIEEWGGLDCEITAGDGGIGTVRSLFGGRVIEILVGQTPLSYGYAQEPVEGQFYTLYHGFMEARPVTETTSKMVYTLFYDVSNLEDRAAKDADVARRRTLFEGILQTVKTIAEAE